jgi:formyltetrahydrofolate synthetase
VQDIINYVNVAAPVDGNYVLVSGFPPKPLNDGKKTVEQAGLKNSALT